MKDKVLVNRNAFSLPWLLVGLAVFALLASLNWIGQNLESDAPELTLFLGRFHPLVLHLPIGALLAAAVLELLHRLRRQSNLAPAIFTLLILTATTALPAAIFGMLLSWDGGYNEILLDRHLWLGTLTASSAFFLISLRAKADDGKPSRIYDAALVAALALLTLTGHYGGSLTHGEGYLTRYLPFQPKATEPSVASHEAPSAQNVFDQHIDPILQDHCVKCHGPEKSKGDFRLDSHSLLLSSGENAPAIKIGDSYSSPLIKLLELPIEHDDHMPPKGKSQPTTDEIELLGWWIDQGASPDAQLAEMQVPEKIARIITGESAAPPIADSQTPKSPAKPWSELKPKVDEITAIHPLEILPLSAQDTRLRVRSSSISSPVTSEDVIAIEPLASDITWLDLSNADLSEAAFASIAKMKNLQRLQLDNTNVKDAHLPLLNELKQLNYLNLVNTTVTDEGLRALERIPSLRKIYLWGTQATPEGIARLQDQLYDQSLADLLLGKIAQIESQIDSLQIQIESGYTAKNQ